jgi:hypothetical protein
MSVLKLTNLYVMSVLKMLIINPLLASLSMLSTQSRSLLVMFRAVGFHLAGSFMSPSAMWMIEN